jgi:hypothetical protein
MKRSFPKFLPNECAAARELARCSAQAFANKAGVPLSTIEAFEAGQEIDGDAYQAICRTIWGRLGIKRYEEAKAGVGIRFRQPAEARRAAVLSRALDGVIDPAMRAAILRRHRHGG